MTSDNEFFYTGDDEGYLKKWGMKDQKCYQEFDKKTKDWVLALAM